MFVCVMCARCVRSAWRRRVCVRVCASAFDSGVLARPAAAAHNQEAQMMIIRIIYTVCLLLIMSTGLVQVQPQQQQLGAPRGAQSRGR